MYVRTAYREAINKGARIATRGCANFTERSY